MADKEQTTKSLLLDKYIYEALVSSTGESNLEKVIEDLLLEALESKVERYGREILKLEQKYGMPFNEFDKSWIAGQIEERHSYEVESDFIDWEMLEMEKKELIVTLATLKGKGRK